MTKMSKKERLAKARAYAKRPTINKTRDAIAVAGAGIDRLIRWGGDSDTRQLELIGKDYSGFDVETGEFAPTAMVRGYGGAAFNKLERTMYNALRIQRPADKKTGNYNMGDVLDYLTYDGSAALEAYNRRDNMHDAWIVWYKTHYGINLDAFGMDAIQTERWLWCKQVPYILQKKIRQLPFVKKQFAKLNKAFGGF